MAGPIRISIISDAANAIRGLRGTRSELTGLAGAAARVGSVLKAGLFLGAAAGIAVLGAGLKSGIQDAIAYEAVQKRATAALKASGQAAGQTLDSIKQRASSIETLTGATIDENDVISAQTRLLRAGIIGKKAFDDATLASANISAANGQSIEGASKVISKALIDPTKAQATLRRQNVLLTDAQQKQITSLQLQGKTAQAQALVIGAVNSQLAGQAKAAGQGVGASFANIKDVLQDTARDLSFALLPALQTVANFIAQNLPAAIAFVTGAFATVGAAIAPLIPSLDQVKSAFATFLSVIQNPVFQTFAVGIGAIVAALQVYAVYQLIVTKATAAWAAIQAALNAVMAANPIGLIVLAVIGLVAALVFAYKTSDTFRAVVNAAFQSVKDVVAAVWPTIKTIIVNTFQVITAIAIAFKIVAMAVWTAISAVVSVVWPAISAVIKATFAVITALFSAYKAVAVAVWNVIAAVATGVWNVISAVVSGVFSAISSAASRFRSIAVGVWNAVRTGATTAFNAVKTAVTTAVSFITDKVGEIKGKVTSAVSGFGSLLVHAGQELIAGLVRGITSKIGAISDAMSSVASKVKGFLPGSPVKEGPLTSWNQGGAGKRLMQLLADGIRSGGSKAVTSMKSVADALDKAAQTKDLKGGKRKRNQLQDIASVLRGDARSYTSAGALLDKTRAKIATYTSKLTDAVKVRDDYASSIADSVRKGASVLSIDQVTSTVLGADGTSTEVKSQTLANIRDVLIQRAADAKSFVLDILRLRKAGFTKSLIDELALAGVEGSAATVTQLLTATPADIASINNSQKAINDSAEALGSSLAKTYYQGGVNQVAELIKGLKSKEAALVDTMDALGKSARNAYELAFGGKTPVAGASFSSKSFTAVSAVPASASKAAAAPQAHTVTLPPASQITNAAAGAELYAQLLAFQKQYGPLELKIG